MAVTCQSNANAHLGDIVQKAQQKRCTEKEIKDDKAKASATKLEAAREHHAVILSIAGLKASVKCKEEAIWSHTSRPDLCYSSSNTTWTWTAIALI